MFHLFSKTRTSFTPKLFFFFPWTVILWKCHLLVLVKAMILCHRWLQRRIKYSTASCWLPWSKEYFCFTALKKMHRFNLHVHLVKLKMQKVNLRFPMYTCLILVRKIAFFLSKHDMRNESLKTHRDSDPRCV